MTIITYNLSSSNVTATLAPYTFESQGSDVVKVNFPIRRYDARNAAKISDAQIIGYVQREFSRQRGGWGLYPQASDCVVAHTA